MDPSSWTAATVRVLLKRVDELEKIVRKVNENTCVAKKFVFNPNAAPFVPRDSVQLEADGVFAAAVADALVADDAVKVDKVIDSDCDAVAKFDDALVMRTDGGKASAKKAIKQKRRKRKRMPVAETTETDDAWAGAVFRAIQDCITVEDADVLHEDDMELVQLFKPIFDSTAGDSSTPEGLNDLAKCFLQALGSYHGEHLDFWTRRAHRLEAHLQALRPCMAS